MRLLLALTIAVLTPCALRAAVVEMIPRATAVLNMDFSPVVFPVEEQDYLLLPREEPYLIQVEVWMRIRDLQPGQVGFSNTAFNIEALGDAQLYSNWDWGIPVWNPGYQFDTNHNCFPLYTCISPWDINADSGANTNDGQAILLAGITKHFGPPEFDIRRRLGQSEEGDWAGTFYLELAATPGATALAELRTPWGASTYDENGFSTTSGNSAVGFQTATFVVVPEPATIVLLAISSAFLALRLRR